MTTLATALSNAAAVMGQTDTQYLYLSRGFVITSDAGQKATPEDLVTDLQTIFHSCKNEADRLNIAKKILITLGIIVPKQGTPESQAHFAKIKEIALQALAPERQTGEKVSRARYFQDNLIILLWAKNLMSACGVEAHTGLSFTDFRSKSLTVFKEREVVDKGIEFSYHVPEDISSLALSILLRINFLCGVENGPKTRPLTKEQLIELRFYCQFDDAEIKKITDDYTLLRQRKAAGNLYDQSIEASNHLKKIGGGTRLMFMKNEVIVPSQSLSAYYPAFDNYVNFLTYYKKEISVSDLTVMKGLYETHLTQLPLAHFAYRYFYNELMDVCSLFSSRLAALDYKKAYVGYEGNALPAPDDFEKIEAVFPVVSLPTPPVEEEKKEDLPQTQSASSSKSSHKKSKAAKSKKQSPPPPAEPKESETVSTTAFSTKKVAKDPDKKTLKKDALPFDEISYDPRVSLWFNYPGENEREIAIYKHAFPVAFDELIGTAYSVRETYQNTKQNHADILFSIPGEIEYESSSKKIRGLFQYCFGEKDKVCYHRYFKEMSTRELLQTEQYRQVFEDVEFPALSSQTASAQPKRNTPDQELVHEPLLNSYAARDASHGLIFRAFKIRDLA